MVKKFSRFLLLSFSWLLVFSVEAAVDSHAQFPIRITIKDYGIYSLLDEPIKSFNAETTAGYASVIKAKLQSDVTTVPLKQGLVFGFNFVITDTTTEESWVPVIIQIKHPPIRNFMGKQSTGFSKTSAARIKADGSYHNGAFYVFSEPYEMAAGEWLISVIYRNEMRVSKAFTVE